MIGYHTLVCVLEVKRRFGKSIMVFGEIQIYVMQYILKNHKDAVF